MEFKKISENVFLYEDYVNVYAIVHDNKAILIDFGSGKILAHLSEIGVEEVDYVLHTHYHRDHVLGIISH